MGDVFAEVEGYTLGRRREKPFLAVVVFGFQSSTSQTPVSSYRCLISHN